ncbi:hypothetical protein AAFN75_08920 [Algibacter sp. AS12]|uniref:hypothetical protein n=1 Tax=Algibacter sp. AS12 TaxID=3135773 RepID=UPI00398AA3E7
MKITKILPVVLIGILLSCSSGERVIMQDGTVYSVKSGSFYNKGKDVTEQLSSKEKQDINTALNNRLEAERIAEEKKEKLNKEQDKIEKSIEKAEKKQEALEESQEKLEEKLEAKEDAREDLLKAKEKLQNKKEKYNKLKEKGKLSPLDEEKWKKRFEGMEEEINEYNTIFKNLK